MWSVKWPVVAALVSLLLTGKHASGELVNVAVNKSATQSSTFSGTDGNLMYTASAGLAVDGASSKNYWTGTCALTNWRNRSACINNHWWRVDLEYNYSVHRVDVYRRNNGIQDPLTVRVGDHEEQPQARPAQDGNVLVQVNLSTPVAASTVSISLACSDILQLCEVEVFADVNIGDCSSSSCQNGGTCRGGNNFYTCDCVPGYTGTSCQTNRDECSSSPCQNGGTCRDGVNSYTCVCVPGYTGTNCEDIDECSSSPCQNGGTCRDGVNSYTCVCVPGYTGSNCQTNINECSSSPCQHGGTCRDGVNSYTCVCVPGYTGTNCQTDIDDCSSSPCQHGGTCRDAVNSYTCVCVPGYTGSSCQAELDRCESSPCRHGATCLTSFNNFSCQCGPGFLGHRCEESCPKGWHGQDCKELCGYCLQFQACNHVTGACDLARCEPGFKGENCQEECQGGRYGLACSRLCPSCPGGLTCHPRDGTCPPPGHYSEALGTGVGIGLGIALFVVFIVLALLYVRHRRSQGNAERNTTHMHYERTDFSNRPGQENYEVLRMSTPSNESTHVYNNDVRDGTCRIADEDSNQAVYQNAQFVSGRR